MLKRFVGDYHGHRPKGRCKIEIYISENCSITLLQQGAVRSSVIFYFLFMTN